MFNKVIVAIDKVIDESGWDEPEKGYASSMVAGLFVSLMFFIPVFLVLLAVIIFSIFSDESIFTIQTLLRLVLVIIVLDAMRNSGSK